MKRLTRELLEALHADAVRAYEDAWETEQEPHNQGRTPTTITTDTLRVLSDTSKPLPTC